MGDRAQVKVGDVYLYTHWHGTELKQAVHKALARKQRWEDAEYLTRIIFCEMLALDGEDALTEATGFGISAFLHDDNEHPLIEIDCDEGTIRIGNDAPVTIYEFVKTPLKGEAL